MSSVRSSPTFLKLIADDNTPVSVQADIADEADVPQASALVTFGQLIGGTIGIAISSSLFATELGKNLVIYSPNAPFELVRQSVTVSPRRLFP